MEKEFLEKFKEEDINVEETKKYILKIKEYLDVFMNNTDGELTKEECLHQFLEKYKEELKKRKISTRRIVYGLSQYNSCKEILNLSKSNKVKFNNLVKSSRQKEKNARNEVLYNSLKTEEQLEITLRTVFRRNPKASEKDILIELKKDKAYFEEMLKDSLIQRIEDSILYLDEYGTLDKLIDSTNKNLENLDLKELTLRKRNPLTDDNEELGVLEILDKEYLKNLSVENLLLLDTFWKAKELEERGKISKAMLVIELGDLWSTILYSDKSEVENLGDNVVLNNLKRSKALSFLVGNENQITLKIKRQYGKFLKDNNLPKKGKIKDEIKLEKVELDNIVALSSDLALESCVIIDKLKRREIPDVKNWGEFNQYDYGDGRKEIQVLIENQMFRSPLFMGIPDNILNSYMGKEQINLPKFKNVEKIDNEFNDIMSEMYLPVTAYFKEYVIKKYLENPSSEFFAKLAGKKVKIKNNEGPEF